MSPETVDYKRLIDADVTLWLMSASAADLVKHGVVSSLDQQWLEDESSPLGAGESAYSRLSADGRIQGMPELIVLHSAAYHCPHLFERKAVAWIMKQTGGAYDPNRVRKVWNIVHEAKTKPLPDDPHAAADGSCECPECRKAVSEENVNNLPPDSASPPSSE